MHGKKTDKDENKEDTFMYRKIPKVDVILENSSMQDAVVLYGKTPVKTAINTCLEKIRKEIPQLTQEQFDWRLSQLEEEILKTLEAGRAGNYQKVYNATGVVLHTNLGRAPLPEQALETVKEKLNGYSNLEYDLKKGKRGERYSHFEKLLCDITGAEAALVVNNNAAAALLMISAMAAGKETIVSRGEQIEIGGKFRIPDIIDQSGSVRVEVGTTNKVRISDYEEKINENTAVLLKVHTSNFKMIGFTESVERGEMVALGRKYGIPVIEDLGSGILIDLSKYGLLKEPTVMDSLAAGVDLVSFSGDKLLGGPQAGIIVGKKEYIDRCKKHPLTRAMRIDKFTVAMLETILSYYQDTEYAVKNIPTLQMLTSSADEQREKAECLKNMLEEKLPSGYAVTVVACESKAGGGSLPGEIIPSAGVFIQKADMHANEIEEALRYAETPMIVRIENEGILLDMRTIQRKEIEPVAKILIDTL